MVRKERDGWRKREGSLNEKAMLVYLRLSAWGGRTKDKKVASEVCTIKGSDKDAGTWWTNLVSDSEIRNVRQTEVRCRVKHKQLTLPWIDGGLRILPSDMFMKYTKEMRKVISEHEEAIDKFLKEYPAIIGRAKKRLGKLLDEKRLPTISEIRPRFAIHQDIFPIPQATDFRCQLNDSEVSNIRKNISKSIEAMTEKAMTDLWGRFTLLIEKIEKTMKEPKKIFKDSLITNLRDFCELIPKMNLTDDNSLEDLRKEALKKLAELKPIDLRESKKDRKQAHKTAKEIMEKIKGYTN